MALAEVGVRLRLAGKQKFTGDMKGAAGDVKNLGDKVDVAATQASGAADRWRSFGRAAAVGAGAAAAALTALTISSVQSASALEQSIGGVESVFGTASVTVTQFASGAAQSVGLAKSEYASLAAVVGSQLQRMGQSQADSALGTDKLITLGADLAATYGGSVSDAVAAVGSLLRGERDPIERYAVGIKQADIDARLAAEGLGELEGAAKTQAESQATLALLFAQTANAQGAFARESDTLAGQQERLRAQFEDTKASLGVALLPVLVDVASFLNTTAVPALTAFIDSVRGSGQAGAEIGGIGESVQKITPAVQTFAAEMPSLGQSLSLVSGVLGFFADHVDTVIRFMPLLVAAFLAFKVAQMAANAVAVVSVPLRIAEVLANRALAQQLRAVATAQIGQTLTATANASATGASTVATRTNTVAKVGNGVAAAAAAVRTGVLTAATVAHTVASHAATAAARAWAAGQVLLNVALTANPLGLLVVAIAAVAAGFVLAYRKITPFRNAVDALVRKVKELASAVADSAVGRFVGGIFGGGDGPEARANGGPVTAGESYVVGERRPELFVPDVSGYILPRVTPAAMRSGVSLARQSMPEGATVGGDGASLMSGPPVIVKTYLDSRQIAEAQAEAVADRRARR